MSRRVGIPLGMTFVCLLTVACSTAGAAVAGRAPSGLAASARPAPGGALSTETDVTTTKAVTLNGAGANSIEPFFQRVFYDYNKLDPLTTVTYSPAGSSVGITDIEQNTVNFGDSEVPMAATDLAQETAGPILQIPVDLGGVAISYNIPGIGKQRLKLDGPTLAGIFDGTITNWDDPAIAQASGITDLPDLRIVPVHRADSSGPGYDLDQYLIDTAPAWVSAIGTSTPSKTWPLAKVGVGEQLNTGVATYVSQTRGAIGYIEYAYAYESHFTNVALRNADGAFVVPTERSIALAGANASGLTPFNFNVVNEPGIGTYPLANFSWTLVYRQQPNLAEGIALGKLLYWVVTKGQRAAAALGYAPLPANLQRLSILDIERLENSAGKKIFSS
ncbi:MAG: phosphate ABC transporter substrate-binding protein PstS [Acidimicrobiales bacterium]|jgi:phosphate transport system substrate-binding protein